ncbi:MAG: hypothetical protein Hyperionvirus2_186 [Hyperionvirus sp.]|uniref:Uncharacterized protein n=1 Tax=Hyperionvirus sp. TaxID=2487770 RepID=A0A3G5A6L4_9VIRU|nr:MAG: hypothetical protein Hyperionvirus2_186 [Hyperionvirus sp.]
MGNNAVTPPAAETPHVVVVKLGDFNLKHEMKNLKETDDSSQCIKFCKSHIALNNHPDACYLFGRIFSGLRSFWDMDTAMKYLTLAVDGGNKDALFYLALFHYLGSDIATKNKSLFMDPDSEYVYNSKNINIEYKEFERDYKKSFELFSRAAGYLNNSKVYYYLGTHFEFGRGVEKDLFVALENYKLAYGLGYKENIKKISELYMELKISSDEYLKFLLEEKDNFALGYFHVARVYEVRGNSELAVLYCDELLKMVDGGKIKLTLEEVCEIKVFRRGLVEKGGGKMESIEKAIAELSRSVSVLTNIFNLRGEGQPMPVVEAVAKKLDAA